MYWLGQFLIKLTYNLVANFIVKFRDFGAAGESSRKQQSQNSRTERSMWDKQNQQRQQTYNIMFACFDTNRSYVNMTVYSNWNLFYSLPLFSVLWFRFGEISTRILFH